MKGCILYQLGCRKHALNISAQFLQPKKEKEKKEKDYPM